MTEAAWPVSTLQAFSGRPQTPGSARVFSETPLHLFGVGGLCRNEVGRREAVETGRPGLAWGTVPGHQRRGSWAIEVSNAFLGGGCSLVGNLQSIFKKFRKHEWLAKNFEFSRPPLSQAVDSSACWKCCEGWGLPSRGAAREKHLTHTSVSPRGSLDGESGFAVHWGRLQLGEGRFGASSSLGSSVCCHGHVSKQDASSGGGTLRVFLATQWEEAGTLHFALREVVLS